MTLSGATLRFRADAVFAMAGAEMDADLDGAPVPWWTVVAAPAGAVLRVGPVTGPGCRAYLCVAGGIDVPEYLGSRSTFALGRFGGHAGRTLRAGDVLPVGPAGRRRRAGRHRRARRRPARRSPASGTIDVLAGPHGAPDFFTPADIEQLYATAWAVHFHSDRTGVRLLGPKPTWARPDGGEAGLHPSNIHDNAYAIGTVDFTGDMPIILGRDGPSLGGFVCPATVATTDLWKVGQAKAGDRIRFRPVTVEEALAPAARRRRDPSEAARKARAGRARRRRRPPRRGLPPRGRRLRADRVRRQRARPRAAAPRRQRWRRGCAPARPPGIRELVPGIRSLQVRYDPASAPARPPPRRAPGGRGRPCPTSTPSRCRAAIVHLPLSWDDPATRLAIERYMQTVRADAPWCPWNIEFIRRVNGLASVDDVAAHRVRRQLPRARPRRRVPRRARRHPDRPAPPPRHHQVQPGPHVDGGELRRDRRGVPVHLRHGGPRRLPVRRPHRAGVEPAGGPTPGFEQPWLLRHFDQIRLYPVSAAELLRMRDDFPLRPLPRRDRRDGVLVPATTAGSWPSTPTASPPFTRGRDAAFAAERRRWAEAGLDVVDDAPPPMAAAARPGRARPGTVAVRTPMTGQRRGGCSWPSGNASPPARRWRSSKR